MELTKTLFSDKVLYWGSSGNEGCGTQSHKQRKVWRGSRGLLPRAGLVLPMSASCGRDVYTATLSSLDISPKLSTQVKLGFVASVQKKILGLASILSRDGNIYVFFICLLFIDRISLYSFDWLGTHYIS